MLSNKHITRLRLDWLNVEIREYLEKYQPVIYQTFVNALTHDKLSHAYLISGAPGTPLKEIALYFAKSLLCDNPCPTACNECITCMRVDEGNYPDVMVVDSNEGRIKREDVEKIMNNFDKTALEDKGIMIYILNGVESITNTAINAILKFLEEPGKNVYAFLTTENESKILPTIISRTQVLKLKTVNQRTIIEEAVKEGVAEDDAEILSAFYTDPKTIKSVIETPVYQTAKQALDDQLSSLLISGDDAIFTCEKLIISNVKTIECASFYLKMLALAFQDLLNISIGSDIVLSCYETVLKELSHKLKHLDNSLLAIMQGLAKLDINVNIGLLLDHIIYEITKEE